MKKRKKIVQTRTVSVSDLLGLLESSLLTDLAKELNSNKWVIKLKTETVFKLLLYSILESERISLRNMEDNYSTVIFKALIQDEDGLGSTAHSSIRDRLVNIDVRFFERLHQKVYQLLEQHYNEEELHGYHLKRYDSTMVAVFSRLLEGMKVGNTRKQKNQVKFTTELTDRFGVKMRFSKDQGQLSEEVALKEMIQSQAHSPKDIIVFDRGLKSRQSFKDLNEGQVLFVTRLHEKNRHKFIRTHEQVPDKPLQNLDFIQDSIVYLYGNANHIVKEEFRLIEVQRKEDSKKLFFLTNILFLSAAQIAEIYRSRWDIEVFFRFLKQEMNLTHFVCNDPNAIEVMMYCTLIAAMLVLVYKTKNGIKSYKIAKSQFFKELQAAIMLELIETPEGLLFFKKALKDHVAKFPPQKSG